MPAPGSPPALKQLADAVSVTLGPAGRNVILQKSFGSPTVTKDGVTVAKEVELPDPFENMGAKLVTEASQKTNDVAGDGTTTATVLAEAIYREGLKAVAVGREPDARQARHRQGRRRRRRRAEGAVAKKLENRRQTEAVATISANHDAEIGKLLAEAVEKVGKDGVITVEEGKSRDTMLEYVDGMQFDKGYISPYFITDPKELTRRARGRATSSSTRRRSRTCASSSRCSRRSRAVGQAAAHHRRGRRGRGAGGARRQPAARRAQGLRRQGAGLRRPPQGHARGHRGR